MSANEIQTQSTNNPGKQSDVDELWGLVGRVSKSKEFSRAARLRDFLQYVCRGVLTNQTQDLREQNIGCAVFGRHEGYNPAEDNIVRVEARELRKRLDRYFARKAGTEPIRISMPKGSYVPVFEANTSAKAAGKSAEGQEESGEDSNHQTEPARASLRRWGIPGAIFLVIGILLGVLWTGSTRSPSENLAPKTQPGSEIWPLLFPEESTINIVSADASLVLFEYITNKTVSLSYYLSSKYGEDARFPVLQRITPNPYIDLSGLRVTAKIIQAIGPQKPAVAVRYPRYINLGDLDSDNLVFLGSAFSDPWIYKFHPQMNFFIKMDPSTRNLCFANKNPEKGEPKMYCASGGPGQEDVTYGVVTLLPNLQHTGNVLLLAGTTGAGTEAAGALVTDPHYSTQLFRYLKLDSKPASLPYFQILLKTTVLNNNPGKLEVVAHRIIQ